MRHGRLAAGLGSLGGDPDEAGDVVGLVLDAVLEHGGAVEGGGGGGSQRRPGPVVVGDLPHGLRRARGSPHLGARQLLAEEAGALRARLGVGEHDLDPLQRKLARGRSGSG